MGHEQLKPNDHKAPAAQQTRRAMLTKAAVAGLAAWTVPVVVSVSAAQAESTPAVGCVEANCGVIEGVEVLFVMNNCAFTVFGPGGAIGPGGATAGDANPGQTQVKIFRTDGRGQPIGSPIQVIDLGPCAPIG
jgi:hypothetical protein